MSEALLPIHAIREELLERLRRARPCRLILRAPTGSGKSTQVPQMLLDAGLAGDGLIIILQPRRLAARMLAARVASERGVRLGGEVGYQIRLDNVSSARTRILYVTEGILLRRMLADPALRGVAAIVFDEFHERHLFGDLSLARALDLQESGRPDIQLIVMSATLQGAALAGYLAPCEVLESEGRTFPVEIEFLDREPRDEPVWERAAEAVADAFPATPGNALVFMSGAYEIQRTIQAIQFRLGAGVPVLPLHGELPPAAQDAAVAADGARRIIVSTNVAETSLTIRDVTLVVDAGLARVARFDPHRGINTLYIEKISHASADQRAGRAGRTAPGRCLRLWTRRDHEQRPAADLPEIKRLDLAETVLTLRAAGVGDLRSFRWLEPPDARGLERAESLLRDLGAIDDAAITDVGRRMLSFPVHPRYARMFLAAQELGCVRATALIAAITQSRGMLLRAEKRMEELREEAFGTGISDFQILMRAWAWADRQGYRVDACRRLAVHADAARQVGKLFEQFLGIAKGEGLDVDARPAEDAAIARCVLAGFADQVARRRSMGTLLCDVVHGRRGLLARASVAQGSRLLVAAEINDIEGRGGEAQITLSLATEIEEGWLRDLFPGDFCERSEVCFDSAQNRVVVRREKIFRDLSLESRDRDAEPSPEAAACLAREVLEGNLVLRQWDDAIEQWICRVNRLAAWMPDLGLPAIGDGERELLIHEACAGATSYRDIKDRPVRDTVRAWLTHPQQQLVEEFAPERIDLPGGRRAKITYAADAEPFIAARIQDLYGLQSSLRIAGGRVPLTIQVLAPNMRAVQVTTDLANFWADAYPKLKQQLSRQYPKHEWR
ncbi:MAG: ATP-dependent helicase HrpB [Terrimicrobiaceae bacterium]|nr:ATP-dependent helicase HrpB [Terrimicrobiaceae bacterium]